MAAAPAFALPPETAAMPAASGNWWAESPEALHLPADGLDDTDDVDIDLPGIVDDDEES